MCQKCQVAVTVLSNFCGVSKKDATESLWAISSFPMGAGEDVLRQVNEGVRAAKVFGVPKEHRLHFLYAKADSEMEAAMEEMHKQDLKKSLT